MWLVKGSIEVIATNMIDIFGSVVGGIGFGAVCPEEQAEDKVKSDEDKHDR